MLNAPVAGTDDLYTTVRNLSDSEKFFGFLPPNGRRLGAGEELSIFGHLESYIIGLNVNERKRRSLEAALTSGILAIAKTPGVFLFDETRDATKVLSLDDAVLTKRDPSWGAYSSSLGEGH